MARFLCKKCGQSLFVPFSCKKRLACPNCDSKRSVITTAHAAEDLLPYVVAYEDRMISIQKDCQHKGVRFLAINSNDDVNYPEDSFENMVLRAKEKGFNFPYLHDDSQKTAKAYGATHTPHLFVFGPDRRLVYTGKIDDNWENPKAVKQHFLRNALDAIITGKNPAPAETHAIGCTIKWKR